DALLADVDRDEQLALRGGERGPARKLAAAALDARGALLALLGTTLGRLGELRRPRLLLRLGALRGLGAGLLAALAAPRSAAPLGLCCSVGFCDRRLGGGRGLRYFGDWSGGLDRRLLPLRLLPAEPLEWQQQSSRSWRAGVRVPLER